MKFGNDGRIAPGFQRKPGALSLVSKLGTANRLAELALRGEHSSQESPAHAIAIKRGSSALPDASGRLLIRTPSPSWCSSE